ncbi:PA4575 family protein [Pseudomonas matsuisoli]|nr:hypothetical protein [Pseudomonas matsuisoli]
MSSSLCLTRQCIGMETRIECIVRPMAGDQGLWTLICSAGVSGKLPTVTRSQGPFRGSRMAQSVLDAIATNLCEQGYVCSEEPLTWRVPMQAELRRVNGVGLTVVDHSRLYT